MENDATALSRRTRPLNSASNLHQRKLCPGSAWAEFGLVEAENEDSREGTLLHWLDAHPEADRAHLGDEQRRTLERNAKLRETFLRSVRFEHDIMDGDPCEEMVETEFKLYDREGHLWMHPVFGEPFVGHPDRVLYFSEQRIAVIFDSKFGRKAVPHATLNMQLRAYAVMVAQTRACRFIYVAITQPWCANPDNFHSAGYGIEEISGSHVEIAQIIDRTVALNAPRNPSPEACEYCLAKADCRPALEIVRSTAARRVLALPPADLEAMAPGVKLAKAVCEAWTDRMKEIARTEPDALKLHMLGKQGFTTKITSPREAFRLLWEAGYLGDDQKKAFEGFVNCMSIGLEKLRELVMEHSQINSEKASAIIEETLEAVILKEPRERSLVKKK